MMLMEVFATKNALNQEQRAKLSQRLVNEVMRADKAPAAMIERTRAFTYVVIHELELMPGGQEMTSGSPPHYLVRMTIPAGNGAHAMRSGEVVDRITRVLAEVDGDSDRLYQELAAWVQIIEVPDGNMGVYGQVARIGDLMKMVLTPGYKPDDQAAPSKSAVPSLIDPICGMSVPLDEHAITAVQDGTTYAFCSTACRDLFLSRTPASAGE